MLRRETDSNFGFNLPWWDWLFGTLYQPKGHETFRYGIYGEPRQLHPGRLVTNTQVWSR